MKCLLSSILKNKKKKKKKICFEENRIAQKERTKIISLPVDIYSIRKLKSYLKINTEEDIPSYCSVQHPQTKIRLASSLLTNEILTSLKS